MRDSIRGVEELAEDLALGFGSEILFTKDIWSLYEIMVKQVDNISEVTGFDEVDLIAATNSDNGLVRANQDLANVTHIRNIYTTAVVTFPRFMVQS